METSTAPDPPESPLDEETAFALRRHSTLDPPETPTEEEPCSTHEPPRTQARRRRQRGLEPIECQIEENPNLKSSITSLKSPSDCAGDVDGAMVLYEYEPLSSPTPTDPTTEEEQEPTTSPQEAAAQDQLVLAKTDPSDTSHNSSKAHDHHGRELAPKQRVPPPAAATSTEVTTTEPQDLRRGFDHCFVTVPTKERLSVLFATLRRSSERKVVVICSTWESSKFHAVLFRQLEMLRVYELHEHMDDDGAVLGANLGDDAGGGDVARAYDEFLYSYPGILFASDMAMREFEMPPNVDYVVQYEPPANPTDYVFRMSNARVYRTSCHVALLFLNQDETHFLEHLDDVEGGVKELEARKVPEFQGSAEGLVAKHGKVNDLAWRAFRAFVVAYEGHLHGKIYDATKMDEAAVRKSFGQPHLPELSAKYFAYNPKQEVGEKKKTKGDDGDAEQCDDKDGQREHQRYHQKQPPKWAPKDKTWRKGGVPWTTRENKTWRHTHKRGLTGDKS